jgi:hypothetical protein
MACELKLAEKVVLGDLGAREITALWVSVRGHVDEVASINAWHPHSILDSSWIAHAGVQ